MKYYTGIGSRETPGEILELMTQMARHLARKGLTLRSGGAKGADQAFEEGCNSGKGLKEIYLPWPKFEGSKSELIVEDEKAFEIAELHHPYWANLSQGARRLQARNSHQLLGEDLMTSSNFVICYTKDGKKAGGTGQAIRIANHYKVPVFDCGEYENNISLLKDKYREFYKKHS